MTTATGASLPKETRKRLEIMASSSIVGGDIRAALREVDRLTAFLTAEEGVTDAWDTLDAFIDVGTPMGPCVVCWPDYPPEAQSAQDGVASARLTKEMIRDSWAAASAGEVPRG